MKWLTWMAVLIPVVALASVCGCQFKPDPACPGGQVVVTKCAVCRMVWSGSGYVCVGPDEYRAATQATQPATTRPTSAAVDNPD
jgi:hypothetical protein